MIKNKIILTIFTNILLLSYFSAVDVSSIYCDDNIQEEINLEEKELENENDKKAFSYPLTLGFTSLQNFKFNSYYALHIFESALNNLLFTTQQVSLFILFCCLKTHL